MPPPVGSLEDIETWAKSEFPRSFAELTKWNVVKVAQNLDGREVAGAFAMEPTQISVIPVGQLDTREPVFACLSEGADIKLFSKCTLFGSSAGEDAPFKYTIENEHPDNVDRLESLIRYYYLRNGESFAVLSCLDYFKEHFHDACKDVARGIGATVEDGEMQDNTTLSRETTPELEADTEPAGLRDNPTTTRIFKTHIRAMDESYHDFKANMLRRFGSMQEIDKNELAQIQAKNTELERRIALLEEGQAGLKKKLATEKGKVKTATEQAVAWKSQYEKLKRTLEGLLA